ncbi:MAG: metallopeptidase family protein [Deltaproteobacteria bacterium]|nr:metallopeptidase family protein [Deltaproteobacteria bacterium]
MSAGSLDAADQAVVDHLVAETLERLDADDLDAAARSLAEAETLAPQQGPVLAARGELHWALGELAQAKARLQEAVHTDATLADAHHALARLHEADGEHRAQVRHDLEVLRLDAAAHRRAGVGSHADRAFIEAVAVETLDAIPAPFDQRLATVPIVLEARPDRALVEEGFDPRAFGLFEGPDEFGRRTHALSERPTRIVVFFANLLDAFGREEDLRTQIEVTLLHEIGHFFGLDEDGVDALGLR